MQFHVVNIVFIKLLEFVILLECLNRNVVGKKTTQKYS